MNLITKSLKEGGGDIVDKPCIAHHLNMGNINYNS